MTQIVSFVMTQDFFFMMLALFIRHCLVPIDIRLTAIPLYLVCVEHNHLTKAIGR